MTGVPGRVHPNDVMFIRARGERAASYVSAGENATALLGDALTAVDRDIEDVRSWLDFGCGHGRVLRHLVQRVPPDHIWAGDADRRAVAFCVEEFGVHPFDPEEHHDDVMGPGRFDVIYAFSVLTHLPEPAGMELLAMLGRALGPRGLLVFTTHGETSVDWMASLGEWCAPHVPRVRDDFLRAGFSYRPYPHYAGDAYGLAWHAPGYVTDAMERLHGESLRAVAALPQSFGGHQDTFVYQRRP